MLLLWTATCPGLHMRHTVAYVSFVNQHNYYPEAPMRGTAILRQQKYNGHRSLFKAGNLKTGNGRAVGNTGNAVCFMASSRTALLFNNQLTVTDKGRKFHLFVVYCFDKFVFKSIHTSTFLPTNSISLTLHNQQGPPSLAKCDLLQKFQWCDNTLLSYTVKDGSLQGNCHDAPANIRWSKQLAKTATFKFSSSQLVVCHEDKKNYTPGIILFLFWDCKET